MNRDNCSVLVVENEIIIADDICRVLLEMGLSPLEPALNIDQAKHLFIKHHPDLIILDVRLIEDWDGCLFAKWMSKEHPTPVLFLTVYDKKDVYLKFRSTQSFNYLNKPFVDLELKKLIEQVLN